MVPHGVTTTIKVAQLRLWHSPLLFVRAEARATDDVDADVLVVVSRSELGGHPSAVEERHTAARHNTLLDRGAHRMHGVADPVLAFLHLDLRGAADMDIPHAGRQSL